MTLVPRVNITDCGSFTEVIVPVHDNDIKISMGVICKAHSAILEVKYQIMKLRTLPLDPFLRYLDPDACDQKGGVTTSQRHGRGGRCLRFCIGLHRPMRYRSRSRI